jgi:mono/diheme cytochrome c family protein
MHRLLWFAFGFAAAVAVALAAGAAFLRTAHGFSARDQPAAIERWAARAARSAALPADALLRKNPLPNTPEILAEARAHWADHCAVCHANDGSGEALIGKRTYPPAPDMRLAATQNLTDGELFYMIQNGVRLTAMPGWGGGGSHDEEDSWKLVHFIRHLPQLTLDEKKEMERLNPKGPEDIQEEQEEEKFLRGDTDEPGNAGSEHHHHH